MSNYSNDFTQIKMGLVNYVGASINAVNLPTDKAKRQAVSAMLVEEAINLSTNENGEIDLYTVKPVYRATSNLYKIRIQALRQMPQTTQVREAVEKAELIIGELDKLIESIK